MSISIIKFTPHSNRADFSESWQALDETGTAIVLTDATIVFSARDPDDGTEVLSADTNDGITISTTTFTLAFDKDDLSALVAKEYDVGCTIEIDDFTTQFFIGTLPIVDGVVP
jgi:hypothetical protein